MNELGHSHHHHHHAVDGSTFELKKTARVASSKQLFVSHEFPFLAHESYDELSTPTEESSFFTDYQLSGRMMSTEMGSNPSNVPSYMKRSRSSPTHYFSPKKATPDPLPRRLPSPDPKLSMAASGSNTYRHGPIMRNIRETETASALKTTLSPLAVSSRTASGSNISINGVGLMKRRRMEFDGTNTSYPVPMKSRPLPVSFWREPMQTDGSLMNHDTTSFYAFSGNGRITIDDVDFYWLQKILDTPQYQLQHSTKQQPVSQNQFTGLNINRPGVWNSSPQRMSSNSPTKISAPSSRSVSRVSSIQSVNSYSTITATNSINGEETKKKVSEEIEGFGDGNRGVLPERIKEDESIAAFMAKPIETNASSVYVDIPLSMTDVLEDEVLAGEGHREATSTWTKQFEESNPLVGEHSEHLGPEPFEDEFMTAFGPLSETPLDHMGEDNPYHDLNAGLTDYFGK